MDKRILPIEEYDGECPMVTGENQIPECLFCDEQRTVVDLDRVCRLALMVTPRPSDDLNDQAWEAISTIRAVMKQQRVPMTVTMQTVFVRSTDDIPAIRRLMEAYFGDRTPTTSFIVQPPCDGQALAIEAWALGGEDVDVNFLGPDLVTVEYDGLRWIYINGITSPAESESAYEETQYSFAKLAQRLESVGATFNDVPRVWLYQSGITEMEPNLRGQEIERYRELNRARTDFFDLLEETGNMNVLSDGHACYPASTGIGIAGSGLTVGCMALQTEREDVRLIPLENPGQTSAFDYAREFSAKSPKFSRAMAVVIGDYVTTWVSGTASILDAESVHLGDIEKQTEQTIDNIEQLINRENFQRHGIEGTGNLLSDLAKVRVYVKRLEDYEKCRAVCERRFGLVPAIYALADVCRPELLVEIEGVAFSDIDA